MVIPQLTAGINQFLLFDGNNGVGIDGTGSHSATNADLDIANCLDPDGAGPEEGCEGYPALCVTDGAMFSFYSILIAR